MSKEWQKVRRASNVPGHSIRPLVSLRRDSLYFNSHFAKHVELGKFRYVTLYVLPSEFRLGFRFHNEKSDLDAYTLMKNSTIQVERLFSQNAWLRAVADIEDTRARRFEPVKNADGFWEIQVCPAFEVSVTDKRKIPREAAGIYRYRSEGDVVYIGRGRIRDRATARERRNWQYDTIEYSVVDDAKQQERWEAYWLQQYVDEHARLPLYNRLKGATDKERPQGKD